MKKAIFLLATAAFGASGIANAHDVSSHNGKAAKTPPPPPAAVLNEEQFNKIAGWDFDKVEIKTQKLGEGFYVLFGLGGNIAASIGKDGTMIVDDQFPKLMPKIKAALAAAGSKGVDFAINTHWHFDHADGNLTLGKEGTWIVSQKKSRDKMLTDNLINFGPAAYQQKAYPEHALSDITFNKTMQFHFNGELVELMHFGAAHTNGDTAIIFRGQNAVHLGDVFNNTGYPFIDADNGGDISGMIAFCQEVYDAIDDETKVIPGHGEVTDRKAVGRYIEVLTAIRDKVKTLIDEGKDFEAVMAAKPTAEFDKEMKANDFSVGSFVSRAYASLIRE